MGIHAQRNVSHLAHQTQEPACDSDGMEFDDYIVAIVDAEEQTKIVASFYGGSEAWHSARDYFLQVFNELKQPCKLIGRVYN